MRYDQNYTRIKEDERKKPSPTATKIFIKNKIINSKQNLEAQKKFYLSPKKITKFFKADSSEPLEEKNTAHAQHPESTATISSQQTNISINNASYRNTSFNNFRTASTPQFHTTARLEQKRLYSKEEALKQLHRERHLGKNSI